MKLKQRRLFSTREFELTENSVNLVSKSIGSYYEHEIPYDEIGTKVVRQKEGKRGWLYAAIATFVLGSFMIFDYWVTNDHTSFEATQFYMFISLVTFTVYMIYSNKNLYLVNDESILEFYDSKRNSQVLNNFIENLLEKRKQYLKNKYAKIDEFIPYDRQLATFNWLRHEDAITEDEHRQLVKNLNGDRTQHSVGFYNI